MHCHIVFSLEVKQLCNTEFSLKLMQYITQNSITTISRIFKSLFRLSINLTETFKVFIAYSMAKLAKNDPVNDVNDYCEEVHVEVICSQSISVMTR